MPLSKNIKNYVAHGQVLDAAIKAGGGRYTLKSPQAARRWRQEAYYFRLLFEREQRARLGFEEGVAVRTPYDEMLLQLDGPTVIIGKRKVEGELRGPDGKAIPLEPPRPLLEEEPLPEEDALLATAEALKKQLIGDEDATPETEGSPADSDDEIPLPDYQKTS